MAVSCPYKLLALFSTDELSLMTLFFASLPFRVKDLLSLLIFEPLL